MSMQVIGRALGLPSPSQGASSTAEFQFTDNASPAVRAQCHIHGEHLKDRVFKVRASGRVIGGTAGNFTAIIYAGTSATIGSNTAIATTGALAVTDAVSNSWYIEFEGRLDKVSDRTRGLIKGWVNATAVAQAISTNVATNLSDTADCGFTVTGTFSASDVDNGAILDLFEIVAG